MVTLPSFEVDTSQDKGYMAQNTVSASRIDMPISDLPFAISAFTPQFINDIGAIDLYDVVKNAAGVTSAAAEFNAGADKFTIRGFGQTPERNGFNLFGQGSTYTDPVDIDRVEVVKGPAALLYGQVSPGGTVNYITKVPEDKAFVDVTSGVGSDSYYRETIDVNQPLDGDSLLFRFNGSYTNGFAFEDIPTSSKTTVLVPSLTWNVTKNLSIKLNYQSFYRYENPAEVYPPNMDVSAPATITTALTGPAYKGGSAALTGAIGIDAAEGFKDAADTGFSGPYPGLPSNFDYDNENDFRRTLLDTLDAEVDASFGKHWTSRTNFDYNHNYVTFNQTGIGDVWIAPPGSLTYNSTTGAWATASAWSSMTSAQQTAAEYAFAQQIQANPGLALQPQASTTGAAEGNPALISRRPRVQYVYGGVRSVESDVAGSYDFPWGRISPLFGAYWNQNWTWNATRLNAGSAASPYYRTWDVDPESPTYYINQYQPDIPITQYTNLTDTLSWSSDEAAYAILNGSFFKNSLYVVAGARYNQSESISYTFPSVTAGSAVGSNPTIGAYTPGQGFRAHYTTPQAGIGYKVTSDSLLYASWSTSYTFSGGNLTQPETVNGVVQSVITGQQKPVTAEGEEIGYKTDFLGGRVSSTVDVYRIVQEDVVQSINEIFPTGTIAASIQGVNVKSQGVEYEATWSPLDNWQVFGSIAEDDIRNITEPAGNLIYLGAHPQQTAKTLGNLWTRYALKTTSLKGLWVGAGFNYIGQTQGNTADPYLVYPSYILWNSAAGYDWTLEKVKFSILVNFDNMANKVYVPADQEVGLPRRFTAAIKLHF
jgi:iron complex outermembrane receptor protein